MDVLRESNFDIDDNGVKSGSIESIAAEISFEDAHYFQDHAVQGVVIVPGTQFLEWTKQFLKTKGVYPVQLLKELEFSNMLYWDQDSEKKITVKAIKNASGDYTMTFGNEESTVKFAELKIPSVPILSTKIDLDNINPSRLIELSDKNLEGKQFYDLLNRNGNNYGELFQGVEELWHGDNFALAKLKQHQELNDSNLDGGLNSVLLDSALHTLLAPGINKQKTAILERCCEYTVYAEGDTPAWSYAVLNNTDEEDGISGNVYIFNERKEIIAFMRGVRFGYLDTTKKKEQPSKNIALAATFTAEPVQEGLSFWGDQLGYDVKVSMSPYNQVFQELLSPDSLIGKGDQDLNILMINFEDWIRDRIDENPSKKDKVSHSDSEPSYRLPNGMQVAHINKYETEYLYNEIFVDQCYLKNGITIQDGDTIIDIGANIGMFSMFAKQAAPHSTIYAFEPAPHAFKALQINARLYGYENIHVSNIGISDRDKQEEFTFYEKSSVFSSFNADEEEDAEAVREIVKNMLENSGSLKPAELNEFVDELMKDRMKSQSFTCPLKSLSDIIKENHITQIDLLKIDAEKSEKQILEGIEDADWPKINQIVIEVHDKKGDVIEQIQQLLRDKGFELEIEEEELLQNSGLYNIFGIKKGLQREQTQKNSVAEHLPAEQRVYQNVKEFVKVLTAKAKSSSSPFLVLLCPPRPNSIFSENFIRELEKYVQTKLSDISNIMTVTPEEIFQIYPLELYYDENTDRLGHIPYTSEFYSILATTIMRKLNAYERSPYKVVVLDCDNTLWDGVCGEVGPEGIKLEEGRKQLHHLMLELRKSGFLLCLCSKNAEEDVLRVFDEREDLPLKKEDLVTWKINWEPKSKNLSQLSDELNLGLDSFIFIDDNPVECAEVRANCPQVLTVQLPEKDEEIPGFLNHMWAFDVLDVTTEDKKRTALYQQNIKRKEFQKSATTLRDFIDGLELEIKLLPPEKEYLPRIAQLTQRTNQFNFTTIRRKQPEIEDLLKEGDLKCLLCEVNDRFGNYGQVGLILYREADNLLMVDTFLLSCRVLGRGVEHYLVSKLGEIAAEKGIDIVEITYLKTEKNEPALNFIETIAEDYKSTIKGGQLYRIPADYAKNVSYKPEDEAAGTTQTGSKKQKETSAQLFNHRFLSDIAENLNTVDKTLAAVESYKKAKKRKASGNYSAPKSDTQKKIAKIWEEVLEFENIGIHDNYSELGGTSLKAVQLVAKLRKAFNKQISVAALYEKPTIAGMAEVLTGSDVEGDELRLDSIKQKAAKKKRILRRRR